MVRVTSCLVVLCCFSFAIPQIMHAQLPGLYLDAGAKSDFFYTRELTNIHQGRPSMVYRVGLGFWQSDDETMVLSAEANFASRILARKYGSRVYFSAFSTPQLVVLGSKALNDSWKLEGGMGFALVSSRTESIIYSFPRIPADDYRKWDMVLVAGAEYKLTRVVSLVARAEWGFVPMLNYQPIGEQGELLPRYNDLFYRSLQLCVRFNIIQKRYE